MTYLPLVLALVIVINLIDSSWQLKLAKNELPFTPHKLLPKAIQRKNYLDGMTEYGQVARAKNLTQEVVDRHAASKTGDTEARKAFLRGYQHDPATQAANQRSINIMFVITGTVTIILLLSNILFRVATTLPQ